jgi:hypothetical protein
VCVLRGRNNRFDSDYCEIIVQHSTVQRTKQHDCLISSLLILSLSPKLFCGELITLH